jgi:Cu2+-exporting ATPase
MTAAVDCFHCGQPVPQGANWTVTIDSVERLLCCPGCAAVARSIADHGLGEYYRSRDGYAPAVDAAALAPPELLFYDSPEAMAGFAAPSPRDADLMEASFSLEGLRCAACVWLIERQIGMLPGVQSVNLNAAHESLHVQWRPDACKPSDILKAVHALGYAAYPFDMARQQESLRRAGKKLFRQMFIAGLSMMQVMMYAVPAYLADDGTLEADMASLMQWASLLLTAPAVFYSALPFFKGAWDNLKNRVLGMDVPVALGIAAAFAGSVSATLRGEGEVYFDSVTMFIFLLLCSRYLELLARRKAASSLERLQHALPAAASRLPDYPATRTVEEVPAMRLAKGDAILLKPGEPIPADCELVEGDTTIDVSLLTGESKPQRRIVGEALPGGAVNASQAVIARVTNPVSESTLSALVKLIERAGHGKPRLSQWADRVAAWFVAALLLFAAVVFFVWHTIEPTRAWPIAIAVLVVSCPCALSLATPSALAAATDLLIRRGVLTVQPHVLEALHRATHVIFDKTGTLTSGKPVLSRTEMLGALPEAVCLQVAAALEAGSAHPLSAAIVAAAEASRRHTEAAVLAASAIQSVPGQGLEGYVDGVRYRLGRADFVGQIVPCAAPQYVESGASMVWLGSEQGWLARFALRDAVREDAREVVAHFQRMGKEVILLSGDSQTVTQRIAQELGIAAAYGERLPQEKLAFVQQLQAQGAVVAMTGDGINDAAVLSAADVSFAMGGGAALAQTHADAVLLSGRLASLRDAALVATRTMTIVRQNLVWASLYNLVAIPAAALGLLNPWLSGIGMSLSSAFVVMNALRLRRMPPAGGRKEKHGIAVSPHTA